MVMWMEGPLDDHVIIYTLLASPRDLGMGLRSRPGNVIIWPPVLPSPFWPFVAAVLCGKMGVISLPKTHIDPENGPMEGYFPLPTSGFQGPC